MGEKIAEWIEKIATGKKARVFWALVIILAIAAVIAYPYIDANILFYNRIEKRVDNLQKLVSISGVSVEDNPSLQAEYLDILHEMEEARTQSEVDVTNRGDSKFVSSVKFWGGTFFGVLVAIAGLFSKNPNGRMTLRFFLKNNVLICILGLMIGALFGYVFTLVPTIGSVWINVILSVFAQYWILDLLLSQPKVKS